MNATSPDLLRFTEAELDLLGRTADALSAYRGRPVLAELIDAEELGYEWVVFGSPLDVSDDAAELPVVQMGGPGARLLGGRGGLPELAEAPHECEYLWAIQLSDLEGVRFIKVDGSGEESGWTDDLADLLPFEMTEVPPANDDDDDDDAGDEDGRLDDSPPPPGTRRH